MTRIAYLGPAGTWSEAAALCHGGDAAELLALASLPAVVAAVETGLADVGVLPVENSLEGAVGTTLDLLIHETDLQIVAEVVVPIRHMLLARPGTRLEEIQVLRSHPQALAQCRRFIERVLPNVVTAASLSTTAAVEEMLAESASAAISTPRAAELYPVQVLARDIQDKTTNATRFIVLAAQDAPPTGHDKTSLAFSVPHNTPGSLVRVLQIFAEAEINLTKVESRPARERLGQYIFLCDLEGHRHEPRVREALRRVAAQADWLKIFGSYPAWRETATVRPQRTP
ncbi:prephenate dehydratase [Kallotenue papyrolyticum]|uniref:prephenate dehydratase n=1 Tax=Kallotenue papyrolyticum TaxID=1325125 RepID=UPI0004785792|nr:prephenate dehydratase [Kallotenue papyrolyticum]